MRVTKFILIYNPLDVNDKGCLSKYRAQGSDQKKGSA